MAFIDAKEVNLQTLLSSAQEAYKVPRYQRTYAWNKDHWEDLLEDIKELVSNEVHFLGSIVVVPESEHRLGVNHFNIVDGQQRLATILIWLSALRDIAKENDKHDLANHINNTFLFAREWEHNKQKEIPKLRLGKLDDWALQRVLGGEEKNSEHSIFECYKFFKKNTSPEVWQTLLNNVSIVHINAFSYLNAFRLFETLNDRGLELSAADLIKNFLLMNVSSDEAAFEKAISKWNEMYKKVRDKEPVRFIRRYILGNYKGKISEAKLYDTVKRKFEKASEDDIINFIEDLNLNASIYEKIHEATFDSDDINYFLKQLHLIEVAPSYTLLLKIMAFYEEGEISEKDVLNVLDMIEVFHIRWGVCGQSTSRLDQIYNDACMQLTKKQPSHEIVKTVRNKLTSEIKRNADNEVFRRSFANRNFKPSDSRTKYILWKLSKPTGETVPNIREIQTEHIMPQSLDNNWIEYLKNQTEKNKQQILALHQENVNRIGNLAIIKGDWNKAMSNRLFDKKKNDYEKSEFTKTRNLADYEKWNFEQIEQRSKDFAKIALEVWRWE